MRLTHGFPRKSCIVSCFDQTLHLSV